MTYLLTGGSGILGTELQKYLNCYAFTEEAVDITWPAIEMYDELYHHFDIKEIDAIIHCAAYTNVPHAENEKGIATDTNVIGTKNIVNLASMYNCNTVYISTDYVYPGQCGGYKETDRTQPINFYSLTKCAGEAYLRDEDLIIRTSFKPNIPWPFPKAFDDLYTSADYVDIIAPMMVRLIEGKASGVYNVGTKRKSVYDLACSRNPEIKPMSKNDIKNVYLPSDTSMDTNKYQKFIDNLGQKV